MLYRLPRSEGNAAVFKKRNLTKNLGEMNFAQILLDNCKFYAMINYEKQSRFASVKCLRDGELPAERKVFLRFAYRIPLENNMWIRISLLL